MIDDTPQAIIQIDLRPMFDLIWSGIADLEKELGIEGIGAGLGLDQGNGLELEVDPYVLQRLTEIVQRAVRFSQLLFDSGIGLHVYRLAAARTGDGNAFHESIPVLQGETATAVRTVEGKVGISNQAHHVDVRQYGSLLQEAGAKSPIRQTLTGTYLQMVEGESQCR